MVSFLKKAAIVLSFLIVLFLAGLIFEKPGLFSAVIGIIGAAIILFLCLVRQRIPEAGVVFVVFLIVAVLGLGLYNKAQSGLQSLFGVREVQAASEENIVIEEPHCVYEDRYPAKVVQWCFLIEAEAAEYGMDPLLIASLILVESGGQPEVISSSGAVGLMQVMPSDGVSASFQCINGPCFAGRPTIAQLKDPTFNVDYGTRFLSGLVTKNGDIREALKAYGPDPDDLYALYGSYYWYADLVLSTRNSL